MRYPYLYEKYIMVNNILDDINNFERKPSRWLQKIIDTENQLKECSAKSIDTVRARSEHWCGFQEWANMRFPNTDVNFKYLKLIQIKKLAKHTEVNLKGIHNSS